MGGEVMVVCESTSEELVHTEMGEVVGKGEGQADMVGQAEKGQDKP